MLQIFTWKFVERIGSAESILNLKPKLRGFLENGLNRCHVLGFFSDGFRHTSVRHLLRCKILFLCMVSTEEKPDLN